MSPIILGLPVVLLAAAAIVGNGFVCYTVRCNAKLHTSTFILIVGQCVSDMIFGMCFVTGLWVCSETYIQNHGNTICSIGVIVMAAAFMVSSLTMTAIDIGRYILIFHPFKPKLSLCQAWLLNLVIYVIGFFLAYAAQVGYIYRVFFGPVS